MLASMSQTDWSDVGVSEQLPTGTVTLLLADVEGSTRLWQTQPDGMTAAVALLDRTVPAVIAAACALELQRAPLAPITLRIGIHTGEVQLRDEANYIGPTINRTARLRELAHGGQIVLSGSTSELVAESLPADAWLSELGTHRLRDLPRPERVVQLCHPDLCKDFPPLRTPERTAARHLPTQLTSFAGRGAELDELRRTLDGNRFVTLTGAGGVGKTRLAIQIAAEMGDGAWFVDLAPITDPDVVTVAAIRAFGLPDQPGRSAMDTLLGFVGDRRILVVLDNCEHLLDATAALVSTLLGACSQVTFLATSREPIALAGEMTWRVPSLSLADEAAELFTDRARLARPDFELTDRNTATATEICRRLDGMPLAIELAAARVRALSLNEILDGLRDRFRLLTGGSRTAVRRQQTLRASVDWSHALLTEPERVLFRRLAAFMGGFDLHAAQIIAGSGEVERYQVLDQLTLLVDKSLVVTEEAKRGTRYRLLETVRQCALEKLSESGEADGVRTRHRDYYTSLAGMLDAPTQSGHEEGIEQAGIEIENLRAAFAWSRENADIDLALQLASSLQPLWLSRGRLQEGLAWFDAALADCDADGAEVAPAIRAQVLADKAVLDAWTVRYFSPDGADEAVAIARELGERALLVRALGARGFVGAYRRSTAGSYLTEAIELARELGDEWRLCQILGWHAYAAFLAGDPVTASAAGDEGRDLADAIGDGFTFRFCRSWGITSSLGMLGDLDGSVAECRGLLAGAEPAADGLIRFLALLHLSHMLAYKGETTASRAAATTAVDVSAELGGAIPGVAHLALAIAALAGGDVAAAAEANAAAWRDAGMQPEASALQLWCRAETALAQGDIPEARRCSDDAVAGTAGWHLMVALTTRAGVAIAEDLPEQAERDAHDALAVAREITAVPGVPEILELLAGLAGDHHEAARLLGAADAIRQRMGAVRF